MSNLASVFAALLVFAQLPTELPSTKFSSGQDIQPYFEGWIHNADGTFDLVFGYFNRNWQQELAIPAGAENSVEPGGPDRGQPTFFYTRTQRNLFSVVVPKDWGKREVVWTVVANGKTEKAYGWLQPEWEIDPAGGAATGGQTNPELKNNKPPTFAIDVPATVDVGQKVPLQPTVTDDGIPKPSPPNKPAVGQETPPGLVASNDAPVNVPQLGTGRAQPPASGGVRGPFVTWQVFRGPANATFESRNIPVKDGKAPSSVTFNVPGEYVLLGRASDRILFTDRLIKITVTGTARQ
jgi:hypothetical protein